MTHAEFEHIIPHLRPLMVRVGRDFFGNAEDAEDVAQDSLIRLWTYCEKLDAQRNLEALAVMVAKNICVQRYHRLEQLPTSPWKNRSHHAPLKPMLHFWAKRRCNVSTMPCASSRLANSRFSKHATLTIRAWTRLQPKHICPSHR